MSTSDISIKSATLILILTMALGSLGAAPSANLSPAPPQDTPWGASDWTISEFQPNIPNGGRANTIAVKPENPATELTEKDVVIVASESGGLFKSTDGGKNWKHLDGLKPYFTNSVAFLPGNTKVVIATTSEDFSKSNQGGIWRSEDEGATWAPVFWKNANTGKPGPNASPSPPGLADGYSAFEISIAPDSGRIYVASTAGVEIGDPDGKNWFHHDIGVAAPEAITVLSLAAVTPGGANILLAGNAGGVRRSADGGTTWKDVKTSPGCSTLSGKTFVPGCILDMHAFGSSPFATKQAYVVNADKELYYTDDSGDTWNQIASSPAVFDAGCGGIAFVRANPSVQKGKLDMYFGDKCEVYRLTAPPIAGTSAFNYSGTWNKLTLDHGDTRHIAFTNNGAPLLLATDGGLHKTEDGGANWTFTGGGAGGYNALQIYQLKGQWIDNIGQNNLYFGTQDNYLWSSTDSGKTWVSAQNEGDFFEAMPHVSTSADSQVTMWAKSQNYLLSGMSLADPLVNWIDPPGQAPGQPNAAWIGHPKIVGKSFHVQWVEDAPGILSKGLAVTYSLGSPNSWKQYAVINDNAQCDSCNRLDVPRAAYPPNGEPVVYQALGRGIKDGVTNLEQGTLARLLPNPNTDDAATDYPAMTNFGGFGIPATMEGWYRVFAVDPGDPNHLLAPDVINEKMMESTDAGATWHEMGQLASLASDSGKLNFRGKIFFGQAPPLWALDFSPISQISAISFNPDDPDLVAVGTVQNGVFVSTDRAKSWKKVPGSEKATLVSALYWRKADEIIVSTYGRGLWRVKYKFVGLVFPKCNTPDCFHIFYEKPPKQRPSPYDLVVVAINGQIRGARLRDGILQEVFVQPGTTLAYAVASGEAPDITVTETTASMQSLGAASLPDAPRGASTIIGLTLTKVGRDSELEGVLFSPRPLTLGPAPSRVPPVPRPAGPGPSGKPVQPHLEVINGQDSAPGEPIELKGGGLPAGTEVEIRIDDLTVQRAVADRDGAFAATVPAPGQFGFHTVTMAVQGRVVSGMILAVRPGD